MAPALGASGPDRAHAAQHRNRLGRTPYDRVDPSKHTGHGGPASSRRQPPQTAAEPLNKAEAPRARGIASLAGRLKSALGSLWAPEPQDQASKSKQSEPKQRPRLVLSVPPLGQEEFSDDEECDDTIDDTRLSAIQAPPGSRPNTHNTLIKKNDGLQWRSQSGAPRRFDVSIIPNNIPRSALPANVVISAYRQALLQQDEDSTQGREIAKREAQPPAQLQPRKIRRREPDFVPSSRASSIASTVSTMATTAGRYNSMSWGRIRSQRAGLLPPPDPVRDHGHRIELVTAPVVDLSKLPESRKEHPGYITANFDLSDDEPEPIKPAALPAPPSLTRRPAEDNEKTARLSPQRSASFSSRQTALAVTSDKEKPTFSFDSSTKSTTQPAAETQEPKPTNSGLTLPKPAPSLSLGTLNKPESNGSAFNFSLSTSAAPKTSGDKADEPAAKRTGFSFAQPASQTPSVEKPAFNFGAKPAETTTESEPKKPAFSFNAKPATSEPSKPSFSFASKPAEGSAEPKKPAFSFGAKPAATDSTSEGSKPTEATESQPKKPAFEFGSKPAEGAPAKLSFSLSGDAKPAAPEAAAPAAAAPASKPFTFGSTASTPAAPDTSAQPTTNGNGTTSNGSKESKPAFSFGSKPASSDKGAPFQFGSATTPAPASTPAIGNAAPAQAAVPSDKPLFGAKPADKPALSFGSNSQPSAFSFGAKAASGDSAAATTGSTSASATPAASTPGVEKPAFSFDANKPAAPATTSTGFSFGANTAGSNATGSDAPKPAFGFGSNSNSAASTAPKPAFSFGSNTAPASAANPAASAPAQSPAPGSGFSFGSNAPTPAPASTGFTFGSNAGTNAAAPSAAPAPAFGSNGGGFSFNSNAAPAFGGASRDSTPFGDAGANTLPAFGSNSAFASRPTTPSLPALPALAPDTFNTTPNLAFGQLPANPANRPIARPRRRARR